MKELGAGRSELGLSRLERPPFSDKTHKTPTIIVASPLLVEERVEFQLEPAFCGAKVRNSGEVCYVRRYTGTVIPKSLLTELGLGHSGLKLSRWERATSSDG